MSAQPLDKQAYHRELKARSLDTIKVHNPLDQDYTMWFDRFGPERNKVIIPGNKKDIGFGKGNSHLPRHLAKRFAREMIEGIITRIADEDWKKKKKQYRTRDEMLQHAEVEAIRTNDRNLWMEWTPKIWLGVVEKYGGENIPDPQEAIIPDSGDPMQDAFNKLELEDREYEPTKETI